MSLYIALIGKRASGKDYLSEYLEKNYNIPSVRFSSVIFEVGRDLKLVSPEEELTKEQKKFLGDKLREDYGEEFYTIRLVKKIKNKTCAVINGLKHSKELKCLRYFLGRNVITLGVLTNDNQDFQESEDSNLLKESDFVIESNGTREELKRKVETLVSALNITKP